LRFIRSLRAFCLGVDGFTSPPIGQALVSGHAERIFGALGIADLEGSTVGEAARV
jgi:hypothetical protein